MSTDFEVANILKLVLAAHRGNHSVSVEICHALASLFQVAVSPTITGRSIFLITLRVFTQNGVPFYDVISMVGISQCFWYGISIVPNSLRAMKPVREL